MQEFAQHPRLADEVEAVIGPAHIHIANTKARIGPGQRRAGRQGGENLDSLLRGSEVFPAAA
jgi:hypothetical protein